MPLEIRLLMFLVIQSHRFKMAAPPLSVAYGDQAGAGQEGSRENRKRHVPESLLPLIKETTALLETPPRRPPVTVIGQNWVTWLFQLLGNLGGWIFVTGHKAILKKRTKVLQIRKKWRMNNERVYIITVCHTHLHTLHDVIFVYQRYAKLSERRLQKMRCGSLGEKKKFLLFLSKHLFSMWLTFLPSRVHFSTPWLWIWAALVTCFGQ